LEAPAISNHLRADQAVVEWTLLVMADPQRQWLMQSVPEANIHEPDAVVAGCCWKTMDGQCQMVTVGSYRLSRLVTGHPTDM